MIAASEPQEFVPFGRQLMLNHPGSVIVELGQSKAFAEPVLAQRLSRVCLNDSSEKEWWTLRPLVEPKTSDCEKATFCGDSEPSSEKELYVSGRTAVVSIGSVGCPLNRQIDDQSSSRIIKASYTVETPIASALFCSFIHSNGESLPSLCIVETDKIRSFTDGGQDFVTPLQFEASNVWPTKFGLLLERKAAHLPCPETNSDSCSCDDLTTIFSLVHPLDETSPVLCIKQAGILSYMNDLSYKVVFTSEEPSVCLLFNSTTGYHSLWKLRWTSPGEKEGMCGQSSSALINTSVFTSSPLSVDSNHKPPHSQLRSRISPISNISKTAVRTTPIVHTPSPKPASTTFNGSLLQYSYAESTKTRSSSSRIEARLGCSFNVHLADPKPFVPEVCLEYLWSEAKSPGIKGCNSQEGTRKAFLTKDVLGQEYLGYLVGCDFLSLLRLGRTNSKTPELIVGTVTYLPASDAVPIPALNLIAALEPGGGVVLYSGTVLVGKLYIGGVSSEQASVTYLSAFSSVTQMNSPFSKPSHVKRPCVLSSTKIIDDDEFDEKVNLLSPVPTDGQSHMYFHHATPYPSGKLSLPFGCYSSPIIAPEMLKTSSGGSSTKDGIIALRDPVGARFTVEYGNGSMFRFTLPGFSSSPLVTECIKVLKVVLPKDVALQLLSKWYSVRNAPGTQDICPNLEWQLFISALFDLFGYHLESLPLLGHIYGKMDCETPAKNTKKMRGPDCGTLEDWTYLINSSYHGNNNLLPRLRTSTIISNIPCPDDFPSMAADLTPPSTQDFKKGALLFPYIYVIMFPLHLLYEDMKLNPTFTDCLSLLVKTLYQLSRDLNLQAYAAYYSSDRPLDCLRLSKFESQVPADAIAKVDKPFYFNGLPPSIFSHLHSLVLGNKPDSPYPYIFGVNNKSKEIVEVVGIIVGKAKEHVLLNVIPPGSRCFLPSTPNPMKNYEAPTRDHEAALLMTHYGITREELLSLPAGIGAILGTRIQNVTESPCQGWPLDACRLVSRLDLVPNLVGENHEYYNQHKTSQTVGSAFQSEDEVLKLRFDKDRRVETVRKMLQSNEPAIINLTQRPEVSDHEFIEEQERYLYAISTRTMALPVGRGMMDLHSTVPVVVTEQLEIPKLCLNGKAPPRGVTVDLSHIEVVPNMNLWPSFHNGVAAGLRVSPRAKNVKSTWITFNKPKNGQESLPEHAGFLMALGLSGHLNNLSHLYLYNYLNKCHEMTSVGVLLGLAASKRGTMNVGATKIFSLHIESLLPPTSIELDLVQNIQVAALLGIGLVYQGTGHPHIAEALLSEIGRPPGPEMENSCDREGYSLAAGLGLGLVMLGKGSDPTGLAHHDIADTLQYYMVGGHRRPLTGSQKEKYKSPSYQIREGDCVNNHVTGPGATLALGMMYFNSGNVAVSNWLSAPEAEYMLDFVCPDQLLLRTLARGLVLWSQVVPSRDWVESHFPSTIRPFCLTRSRPGFEHVDHETMTQAYCNIVAGACMAVGLRFAGTANNQAFNTLHYYCKLFISMASQSIGELAGTSTVETCICVTLLSLATVMVGTGDLDVLRMCRHLSSRVGRVTNSVVTYGSHLAVHMALGLLFLGGGSLSFSNSPEAVAALVCAFFPRFPTHSNDNRYHLQAFRHLYVLAVEPRLFLPKDIDSGALCYANLEAVYIDTPYYSNQTAKLFAPCILPHLSLLREVKVTDDRYWPIVFTRGKNWDQLVNTLEKGGKIGIKLRAGCLPYVDDPHGYKTLLAQTLSSNTAVSWSVSTDSILSFVSDKATRRFVECFLKLAPVNEFSMCRELKFIQWLSSIAYECITQNKLPLLDYWIILLAKVLSLESAQTSSLIWQEKLALAIEESHVQADHTLSIMQYILQYFRKWQTSNSEFLNSYMRSEISWNSSEENISNLSSYTTYYSLPDASKLTTIVQQKPKTCLEFIRSARQVNISTSASSTLWHVYKNSIYPSS